MNVVRITRHLAVQHCLLILLNVQAQQMVKPIATFAKCLSVTFATWSFLMEPICVATKCVILESSLTSAGSVRNASLEKIILQSTLQLTPRHCHITVRFATEASSDRLQCEPTFRMSMLANMIWSSLVPSALIEQVLWRVWEFTFLTGIKFESKLYFNCTYKIYLMVPTTLIVIKVVSYFSLFIYLSIAYLIQVSLIYILWKFKIINICKSY